MATTSRTDSRIETAEAIPPLRNGDRLSRDEFERRYRAMPFLKKAELIEGYVYIPSPDFYAGGLDEPTMASPVSARGHAIPHGRLMAWLSRYFGRTPGLEYGDNGSIRLDLDNMPQPDAFGLILPEYGGQAQFSDDDYLVGAPDLVAEVAHSSASYDLHRKKDVYRRNGAREYVVWRVEDRRVDWFVLRGGAYVPLLPSDDGIHRSEVFPGLWLDPGALVRLDLEGVERVADAGRATPEHAEFVRRLERARGERP